MTQRLVWRHRAFPTAGRVGIHRRTSPWRAGALCHPDQPQWTSDRPTVPSSRQAPKRPPAAIAHLTLLVRVPGRPDLIQAFTAAEQVRSREWRWVTRPEVRRPLRPARGHQLSRTDTLLSARTGGLATNRATVRRFRWRTDDPRHFAISGPAGLRRAGIDGDRARGALVHGLRHTFATELANADISAYTLMKLLESMVTSQRYVTAARTETRTAAAQNSLYRLLRKTNETSREP